MSAAFKILLVDDDQDEYLIIEDLLSEEAVLGSYKVSYSQSTEEARSLLNAQSFDAILVDNRLGINSGIEFIESLKMDYQKTPFIVLTNDSNPELDLNAFQRGASDFLRKSELTPSLLDRTIRYSIQNQYQLAEIQRLNEKLEQKVRGKSQELVDSILELQRSNKKLQQEIYERQKVEEELKRSQELYQAIASNFPNGAILVLNRELDVIFQDGMELQKLIQNKMISRDKLFKPGYFKLGEHELNLAGKKLQKVFSGEGLTFMVNYCKEDYNVSAVPLIDEFANIDYILLVAENISKTLKAQREMENALKSERELNELKSRFVAMASHEFRTPLGTILSSINLLKAYFEKGDLNKSDKHITRVKKSVQSLRSILDDFLSLSKLEEGKVQPDFLNINAKEICSDIIDELDESSQHSHRFEFECLAQKTVISGDANIIRQILMNIVGNAIKYSPENSLINIVMMNKGNYLRIDIKDQGIGIPEKEQHNLFERFFRAENVTNYQGTGLGLNIVQRYMKLLNGKVEVKSKENEGSTFSLLFPLINTQNSK